MSIFEIDRTSIVDLDVDIIVNAANESLWAGGGVCGAIFQAAGYHALQSACDAIGHCATGDAVITSGFALKADFIIHAVGPRWQDGKHGEPERLRSAYKKALELALEHNCYSIGFPLISAGIYGYPINLAWSDAFCACADFLDEHPTQNIHIIFAVLSDTVLEAGKEVFLQSFDSRYRLIVNENGRLPDKKNKCEDNPSVQPQVIDDDAFKSVASVSDESRSNKVDHDKYDFEDIDPDVFRDPSLMVKWLQQNDSK